MSRLLQLLSRFLLSRGGSLAVALVVVIGLVWFGGHLVGLKSPLWRLAVIGVLLLLAGLYVAIGWWLARRRGRNLQQALEADAAAGGVDEAELEALREKMEEAVASLKSSGLGLRHRGSAALYALPWYLVIGPSAAGKSTFLRNSGLHFPGNQAQDIEVRGFGGTRNCDWWFADEAVFLDTAGRYTTEEDDRDEWMGFLGLLKKYRRRLPVNGVMVAVSMEDILLADDERLEWHVKVIRERIDELIRELGYLIPVYLVFTKCDLVKGFEAYFGDMSEREREQLLGIWLDGERDAGKLSERIEQGLARIYQRLCDLRLRKMGIQRKHAIRNEIFEFPAQFRAASERLMEFLNLLVKENPYQEAPVFQGVYFSSGTQEGLPLARIVGNLRNAFGHAQPEPGEMEPDRKKSYFIKGFIQDVLLKAPRSVQMNQQLHRLTLWVKGASAVVGSLLLVGALIFFTTSYSANGLLLSQGEEAAERLAKEMRRSGGEVTPDLLAALAEAWARYDRLDTLQRERSWFVDLGLYAGAPQREALEQMINRVMERVFLGPVARAMEARLAQYGLRWDKVRREDEYAELRSDYYQTLKAYLQLAQPQFLERDPDASVFLASWYPELVAVIPEEGVRDKLAGAVRLYLKNMRRAEDDPLHTAHWKAQDELVEQARNHLRTPPNPEVLYAQIRNKGRLLLKRAKLRHLVRARGISYLTSEASIPVLYTRKGWEEFASREIRMAAHTASRGDWVLGTQAAVDLALDEGGGKSDDGEAKSAAAGNSELAQRLEKQMRALYFADYQKAWFEFLGRITVRPFDSIGNAADKVQLLASQEGPIARLFAFVLQNIDLREVPWEQKDGEWQRAEVSLAALRRVPETEQLFADLRRFAAPAEQRRVSDLINQYLLSLASVQGELEQLRASSEPLRDAELYASNLLGNNGGDSELYKSWISTTSLLNGTGMETRHAIEPLFLSGIRQSWRAVLDTAMQEVERKWQMMVMEEYDDRIRGRFPFARNGSDAAISDVAEFFRPGDGTLWSFVENHLSAYLVKRRHVWRQRRWLDVEPGFSRQLVAALNRAQRITEAMFRRNGDMPQLRFAVYPIPSSGMSETLLETNGQTYRYRNGPQEWKSFQWPGNGGDVGARVAAVSSRSNYTAELSEDGPWGLFHLLQAARQRKLHGNEYLSEWQLTAMNGQPVKVAFRLRADRRHSLLQPGLLTGLDLPQRLVARRNDADGREQMAMRD